jgi:RNA 3'-terminal phosphate cyclase
LGDEVGREIAQDVAAGATLDVHAADQLLVYMAMAQGHSRFVARAISSHARTTMWLISKFLPARFSVAERAGLAHVLIAPLAARGESGASRRRRQGFG